MKMSELPENIKHYVIRTTGKREYMINGEQVERILSSENNLFRLKDGTIINKAFIEVIEFDREETKYVFNKLPDESKKQIAEQVIRKEILIRPLQEVKVLNYKLNDYSPKWK